MHRAYVRLTFKRDRIRSDILTSRKFSLTRMKNEGNGELQFRSFTFPTFSFSSWNYVERCGAAYFHSRGRGALHKSTINIFYLYRQYRPCPLRRARRKEAIPWTFPVETFTNSPSPFPGGEAAEFTFKSSIGATRSINTGFHVET